MFDAILQNVLHTTNGFRRTERLLEYNGETELKERFTDLQLAINVLKHGRGRSYDALLQKAGSLPFRIKLSDETFFSEGNVAEVSTLNEVDDKFVILCADAIPEVSAAINLENQNI
jgi:hypothetical protein